MAMRNDKVRRDGVWENELAFLLCILFGKTRILEIWLVRFYLSRIFTKEAFF